MSQAQADYSSDHQWLETRPAHDSIAWREAMLKSYEDCLAHLDKLVTLNDNGSLDRIRASFEARMDELKLEITEMKERQRDG